MENEAQFRDQWEKEKKSASIQKIKKSSRETTGIHLQEKGSFQLFIIFLVLGALTATAICLFTQAQNGGQGGGEERQGPDGEEELEGAWIGIMVGVIIGISIVFGDIIRRVYLGRKNVTGHQDVKNMEQKHNMEVATLGRPFQLGMLYDCRSESLIPGVTLWDSKTLSDNRDVRPQISTQFQIIESDSIEDKSSALNMSEELKASLMGGMIQVQGSAKYLNDTQKSKQQARVTLQYSTTTRFEQLTMTHLGRLNVFDQGMATHVVTAVLYGAQAFFVFDREILSSENLTDVQGHMKTMISNIPKIQIDGEVSQKHTEEEKADDQKFSCTFYGDYSLPFNPITFQDAIDIYTSLPGQLGENGEHAVPMKVWLYPLNKLDSNAALLVRGISVNLISSLQAILENFNEVDMRCSGMMKEFATMPFHQITEKLQSFRVMCVEQRQSLQKSLTSFLPSIRGGEQEEGILVDILINNQQSQVGNQSLIAWLENKQQHMSVVRSILNRLEYIKFVTQAELQKELQMVPKTQYLVCFMFTSLDEEDLYLSEIENCLQSKSLGKGYLPTSADPGQKPLFFLSSEMLECARSFQDLYTANKADVSMKFVIGSVPDKEHKGASIYLYEGGKLVSRCFKPPVKPPTPSVFGKAHDSITLNLQPAIPDASQIMCYRMEYRTDTEEAWDTLTIDNISDKHIISGLSPYKEYHIQYRIVGKPWVSLASDSVSVTTPPTSAPGKPLVEQEIGSDVKVAWQKPTVVGNGVNIHHYKIRYQECCNDSSFENAIWQEIRTLGSECSYILQGLKPSTSYTLQVFAACGQAGESGGSHVASLTTENKLKSPARSYLAESKLVKKGIPAIYQLQLQPMGDRDKGDFVKYSCGKNLFKRRVKTIMVLGGTGSGKTTLINAMANYVIGVEWEDKFRFRLINEQTNRSQAESQTSSITAYELSYQEGFRISHTLNIIDTPGFGDTRGITRDRTIIDQIRDLFASPHGIDQIDAVCFVVQASLARLTTTQKYIFDSILSIFGKDIAENIRVLITFADGQLPPVLAAINQSEIPCPTSENGQPLHFKFNNSALFAEISENCNSDVDNFDRMFWKMGSTSMMNFFMALDTMPTKSLHLTKEVLEERKHLDVTVQGLQPQIKLGLMTLDQIRTTQNMLRKYEDEVKANQNFEYEVELIEIVQIDISGTGTFLTNCSNCHFTCHNGCAYSDDKNKYKCYVMDKNGHCTVCPGKCIWNIHFNQKYKFDYITKKEKRTYEELKSNYERASGEKMTQEDVMEKLEEDFFLIKDNVLEMVKKLSCCLERLKEIALRPNPLSTPEYIDLLIEAEEEEAKPGFLQRIQSLNEVKKQAELLAKVTNKVDLSVEESEIYTNQQKIKEKNPNKFKNLFSWFGGLWRK